MSKIVVYEQENPFGSFRYRVEYRSYFTQLEVEGRWWWKKDVTKKVAYALSLDYDFNGYVQGSWPPKGFAFCSKEDVEKLLTFLKDKSKKWAYDEIEWVNVT